MIKGLGLPTLVLSRDPSSAGSLPSLAILDLLQ
jgi:hypothetical protein